MSDVPIFPPSDCALEWSENRSGPLDLDAKGTEIRAAMQNVFELRVRARLGLDGAIATPEQDHAGPKDVAKIAESRPAKTQLHDNPGLLERLLASAKSGLPGS